MIECEGSKSCKTKCQKWTFLIKKLSFCARKIPNFSYEIFKKARKQVKAAKLSNFHQKMIFYQKLQKESKNLDPNFEWLNNYFYLIFFTNKIDFCNNLKKMINFSVQRGFLGRLLNDFDKKLFQISYFSKVTKF